MASEAEPTTAAITWTNITVRLGDLKPWASNPRQSTKKQAEKLLQSWREFGQVETIAVSPDLDLYNGHQRLSALLTVYGKDYIIEARQSSRHLTEEEKRKLTITLHAGAVGSWSWDDLSSWEPIELKEWGFDDSLLMDWRRDVASLGNFLESEEAGESKDAPPQIDRAAELQKEWGTELGQLWRLPSRTAGNEHRLVCGDCRDKAVVERLMGGEELDLQLTDPPYGINIVKLNGAARSDSGAGSPVTAGTIRASGLYPFGGKKNMVGSDGADHWVDATLYAPVLGDDKPFDPAHLLNYPGEKILFGGNYYASKLPDSSCWIVWDKNNTGNFADVELAWGSFKKGARLYSYTWNGLVREGERRLEGLRRIHPTQKPVGLFVLILNDFSKEGQVIGDFYHGAGATLLACEETGRQCRAVELSQDYIAVALQRYQDAFGITAELIETL